MKQPIVWSPEEKAKVFEDLLLQRVPADSAKFPSLLYSSMMKVLPSERHRGLDSIHTTRKRLQESYTAWCVTNAKSVTEVQSRRRLEQERKTLEKAAFPSHRESGTDPYLSILVKSVVRSALAEHEVRVERMISNALREFRRDLSAALEATSAALTEFWSAPAKTGDAVEKKAEDASPHDGSERDRVVVYGLIPRKAEELRRNLRKDSPELNLEKNLLVFDQHAALSQVSALRCGALILCADYISHSAQETLVSHNRAEVIRVVTGSVSTLQPLVKNCLFKLVAVSKPLVFHKKNVN